MKTDIMDPFVALVVALQHRQYDDAQTALDILKTAPTRERFEQMQRLHDHAVHAFNECDDIVSNLDTDTDGEDLASFVNDHTEPLDKVQADAYDWLESNRHVAGAGADDHVLIVDTATVQKMIGEANRDKYCASAVIVQRNMPTQNEN